MMSKSFTYIFNNIKHGIFHYPRCQYFSLDAFIADESKIAHEVMGKGYVF